MRGTQRDGSTGRVVAPAFRPDRAVGYLAGFAAYGIGLSALYATTGIGLPCPFHIVTGWWCPFCGATRMGAALLRGDLVAAFAANGLVLIALAVLTSVGAVWLLECVGGPRLRLPEAVGGRLGRLSPRARVFSAVALAVLVTLLRNLS